MLKKLILINLIPLVFILAISPAKPGVVPSQKVKDFSRIAAETYTQGGLVVKMQRIKQANIQIAEHGNRELREDVFMSFPVILGSYTDYNEQNSVIDDLQAELFDGPWPTVTMAEHYTEMSYSQFYLSGTVYGWYELSQTGAYYEGSQTEPYDNGFTNPPGGVGDFLQETLQLADLEIDFSQYDNDGPDGEANSGDDDGFVDAAFFVHSGSGGEYGGPYIWSHRSTYSNWWGGPFLTNDMGANGTVIKVNDYIMQPATNGSGGLIEIGVFSHEFGHAIGLPDLYDTDYSSDGIGDWCLMGGGSWSMPYSPTHFSAWCKEMLGWIVPVIPDNNMDAVQILNVEENPYVLKLWTHGELGSYYSYYSHGQDVGREYYLIENRQRIGTEQHIPGTGIVIWHIDNTQYHNSDETHRMVDVVAADGNSNGSSPGDSWPGSTNSRRFDYETNPPAIGWAGVNTEVALLNISDSDSTMMTDLEVYEVNPHLYIADMLINDANADGFLSPDESGE
ncbi:MAG: M6 family metalloprotease domain-containing protein, partial [Candidatus Marinimicrobia bacterium]|nr:M6 family metalloprotease domain-containing protein [Candidatus Neomarinimicrobiota bacterium]